MIKSQLIRQSNKPIAIVIDYEEYKRLKEIEQDRDDYSSALEVKMKNKKWTTHREMKKEFGL